MTLKTGNNNYTTDMQSTINQMSEHFVPEDSQDDNEAHHKRIRHIAAAPMYMPNDEEFTRQEVQAALERFDPLKAPGEDALPSEILLQVFRSFPTVFMEIYECLRKGHFLKQWKRSVILPIMKPGKEELNEVGNFRSTSLINIGGKNTRKINNR